MVIITNRFNPSFKPNQWGKNDTAFCILNINIDTNICKCIKYYDEKYISEKWKKNPQAKRYNI